MSEIIKVVSKQRNSKMCMICGRSRSRRAHYRHA